MFLRRALAAGAAGAAGFPSPSIAKGLRELRMVTAWPRDFPGPGTGAARLARRIGEMSAGRLAVKVFAAGELVPPSEVFDAVAGGAADMYHAAEYHFERKTKALNFFTTVPFGLSAAEHTAWIHHGGGQALWDQVAGGFNLKPFLAGNSGVQMGGWFKREVAGVSDFQGLRVRASGLGGDVLRRLGAKPIALAGGEIFPALQAGKIDAAQWAGPWSDLVFGFHKVAKHYYYPGFHEPGPALSMAINRNVWSTLTAGQRALIETAALAENGYSLAEFNARNADALVTFREKLKIVPKPFTDEILMAAGKLSGIAAAEAGAAGALSRKVYESFLGFRKRAIAWSKLSEHSFARARRLPFPYAQ